MPVKTAGGIKIEADDTELKRLEKDFDALVRELETTEVIDLLAEMALGLMIQRTQKGLDIHGNKFAPYSGASTGPQGRDSKGRFGGVDVRGGWAEARQSVGLSANPVNLTFSGAMLGALDHTVLSPVTAELFVKPDTGGGNDTPRDRVAEYHQNGGGRLPQRSFFGLSESDLRKLEREWVALTLKAMLKHITDARPIGSEISQMNDRPKLVEKPSGPFASYTELAR